MLKINTYQQCSLIFILLIQWLSAQNFNNDVTDLYRPKIETTRNDQSYMVVAPKLVRPGKLYKLLVTVFYAQFPIAVTATIQRNKVAIVSGKAVCQNDVANTIELMVPIRSLPGDYTLQVDGSIARTFGSQVFTNSTQLQFSLRSMTIFIQTERPFYQQGQVVRFRALPINTDLKVFDSAPDVQILDPNRKIMKRWLSTQSNLGAVSLEYPLSNQPVYGKWTIKVMAQNQIEEKSFMVEEYYQTRYEVRVLMPSIFTTSSNAIYGTILANYTSGAPVEGKLTIKATVRRLRNRFGSYEPTKIKDITYDRFPGYKEFHFDMSNFRSFIPNAEIRIEAIVGEYHFNSTEMGHSSCIVYNDSLKLKFLGASPQVIKPAMPFKAYVALSFSDGSPLPSKRLKSKKFRVEVRVNFHNGGSRELDALMPDMSADTQGLWKIKLHLKKRLRSHEVVNDVKSVIFKAWYTDEKGDVAIATLVAYAPRNHKNHLIQVDTSSKRPRIGQYIVFHVRTNYFLREFQYLLISKGIVITTGSEEMTSTVKTFAVALSAEMAPTSTLVVYHVSSNGIVIADSITFPVDGISMAEFKVSLNNMKDKTGNVVEVRVVGEPGSYVGLSAVDQELFAMHAGNELSYAEVMQSMSLFDEEVNTTLSYHWKSREGGPHADVYFPSSSYGIDANRTFAFAGLLVFTDSNMTAVTHSCNKSLGFLPCLDGSCYHIKERCNNYKNCQDGIDESQLYCKREPKPLVNMEDFMIQRYNRLQRLYENSWLWKDVTIGPKGYSLLKIPVPKLPSKWIISGFGMTLKNGFSILPRHIRYDGVRPFFMVVETPNKVMQNEQIGIRATIFNYVSNEIQALITLQDSPHYKFVHVESMGFVDSYSPRTSHGQHQHLVWIQPGVCKDVYIPIVPTHLGEFNVTITASSVIGKDRVTKTLFVEADGLPQHRHTSLTLDLSQNPFQLQYMDMNITESPELPYNLERRYIYGSNRAKLSIIGDVVGPVFHKIPMNTENLLRMPYGSGENSMFNFATNLYMLLYMRYTGLRKRTIEIEAFKHLNIDYQRQLSYRNDDGSFSLFRWNSKGSVWLTAFCTKVFFKATLSEWQDFIYIDPSIISSAMEWLVSHQTEYGSFQETSLLVYDRKMNLTSDYTQDYGRYRNISLTAHVLITLCQVKHLPGPVGSKVASARTLATNYLERMLNVIERFEDPHEIAIVSYALTLAMSPKSFLAFNLLAQKMKSVVGMNYWGIDDLKPPESVVQNGRPYLMPNVMSKHYSRNVETTAYALLTHVSRQAVIQKSIVLWLNSQRMHTGGWGSTQDTIIALEALIKYSSKTHLSDVTDISVKVDVPSSKSYMKHFQIRDDNLLDLQILDIPKAWGGVVLEAEGSGVGILQLALQYNVDWTTQQIPPPIPAFSLEATTIMWGRNNSHISIQSCQSWTNYVESPRSGLAVLEITTPSGYMVQQQILDKYIKSKAVRNLRRATFHEKKIIFYFDYLDRYENCINFTLMRWYPVANISRYLPIKVYEYYAPERFNETFLDVYTLYVMNICNVCGSYQCPYCSTFSKASPNNKEYVHLIAACSLLVIFIRQFTSSPLLGFF